MFDQRYILQFEERMVHLQDFPLELGEPQIQNETIPREQFISHVDWQSHIEDFHNLSKQVFNLNKYVYSILSHINRQSHTKAVSLISGRLKVTFTPHKITPYS